MTEIRLCTCNTNYHRTTEPRELRFSLVGGELAHTIALVAICLDCARLLGFPKENLQLALDQGTEATQRGLATIAEGHPEYYDGTAPERRCHRDSCAKPYRGPAVYCSFECAMADA